MSRLGLAAFLGLAVSARPAAAADPAPLTWVACLAEAREHHPDLLASGYRLSAAHLRRTMAFGAWLPSAGVEVSRDRSRGLPGTDDGVPGYAASLSASLPLFSGFETVAQLVKAGAELRKAQAARRGTEAEVRHDLREAFAAALYAQALVTLRESLAARWGENVALVRRRATGEDDSTRLQAEAEAGKAGFEVSRARRGVARARQRLSRAMGRETYAPLTLADDWSVAPPPVEPDLRALAETGPRVAGALAALEAARAGVREAGAAFWPAVETRGAIHRDGPGWPPSESHGWSTGVTLSLNLFNRLRDRYGLEIARLDADEAEADLASTRRGAIEGLEDALEPYANAVEAVEVRRKSVEAARARANVARAAYETSGKEFDQWQEVENGLIEDEVEYLDARREALETESAWLKATGTGFP